MMGASDEAEQLAWKLAWAANSRRLRLGLQRERLAWKDLTPTQQHRFCRLAEALIRAAIED